MLVFIDGNDLRAAEVRAVVTVPLTVEALQTGFSTSAPEPGQRARDKVLAHPVPSAAFAEAVDLTTLEGKSLRIELDSENPNRFCKYWRETPVRMHVAIALRRAGAPSVASPGSDGGRSTAEAVLRSIELFTATCDGQIAPQPAGPLILGWDRLFVPAGEDYTLAELTAAGEVPEFRRTLYARIASALQT